jgi:hypothetical protein
VAFGLQTFTNYGSTTVVLDHVVLLHPHHERLVGSFAVPGARVLGEEYWPVTSQGMLVYYHDSSGSYVAKNFWANIISANTHTCGSGDE